MEKISFNQLSLDEQNLLLSAKDAGQKYINKKGSRHVGAALLGENGVIYQGTSIRRTNTSNSTCAERMALDRALFDLCYSYSLLGIVGFSHNEDSGIIPPCGLCRQILSEAEKYGQERKIIPILITDENFSEVIKTNSNELLPFAYQEKKYT